MAEVDLKDFKKRMIQEEIKNRKNPKKSPPNVHYNVNWASKGPGKVNET